MPAGGYNQAAANQQDFSLKAFSNQPFAAQNNHNMMKNEAQFNNFLENENILVNYQS